MNQCFTVPSVFSSFSLSQTFKIRTSGDMVLDMVFTRWAGDEKFEWIRKLSDSGVKSTISN